MARKDQTDPGILTTAEEAAARSAGLLRKDSGRH